MAIIKCKACGGDLTIAEGASIAECEFCGRVQTIPKVDDEKKLTLFARANRLRAACDFDKAAGIYETIVAEFPGEAEAYWGLVLCKYGIEYVDDPQSGKKIPTCHRSSFDSVMEDGNFEQAMENADEMALRVYREEAKQFEKIRKGILEVSSREQPYDIFICYKETDPAGDRTVDSVMAQELYSALTDKGYRVFFSRITLQSKLGEAYEPYIFAALNSAKVMLAIGSCYEYYNAVWVKNEWSRYLRLCETDKSKHLIPCYRNLDPEDMPREFNHLQGADLGKMGAVQDILFNMEKYIPLKKQNTTVIQERVVVGGSGDNKIASLLDRGNMALEDGDWAKADSFFEDVLNNDSKNAQAYLGKTLAMEKCRTIDAFVRKRKEASQFVKSRMLQLEADQAHIAKMAETYQLPGYTAPEEIRRLYGFDLSYPSDAPGRRQQYREEETYWANHKQLSRAEKFAVGAVAENLAAEKKALFAALSQRVKSAEAAEAAAKAELQERYARHLQKADQQAEKLYSDGLARREKDYGRLLQIGKNSEDPEELAGAAASFAALGDYKDSKDLAEHCRKRAEDERAKLAAEAERQRILREKQEAERRAKKKRKTILSLCITGTVVLALLFVYLLNAVIIPNNKYNQALEQMEAGNYEAAMEIFAALDGYKESECLQKISECKTAILEERYRQAMALLEEGQFQAAREKFLSLSGYRDAAEQAKEARYREGLYHWERKDYETSNPIFTELGSYKDSKDRIHTHVFDGEKEKDPTCEEAGVMVLTCSCGYTTRESIPAVGHSYNISTVEQEATCTATGVMRYQCHCGDSYTEEIAKKAHNYNSKVTLAATCEKAGTKTYTCKDCSDTYTESIAATGHAYQERVTTAAGCVTQGKKTITCTGCGKSYTETIAATGHSFKAASCEAPKTCTSCGETEGSALGHDWTHNGIAYDIPHCTRCNGDINDTVSVTSNTPITVHYNNDVISVTGISYQIKTSDQSSLPRIFITLKGTVTSTFSGSFTFLNLKLYDGNGNLLPSVGGMETVINYDENGNIDETGAWDIPEGVTTLKLVISEYQR